MYVLVVVLQNVEKHKQMSKSWVKINEKLTLVSSRRVEKRGLILSEASWGKTTAYEWTDQQCLLKNKRKCLLGVKAKNNSTAY